MQYQEARAEAILTKSCVVEGFVTQRPKTFLRFLIFVNFAEVFVPGSSKFLRNN